MGESAQHNFVELLRRNEEVASLGIPPLKGCRAVFWAKASTHLQKLWWQI